MRRILGVVFILLGPTVLMAQHFQQNIPAGFIENHWFEHGSVRLSYNLFQPDSIQESRSRLPLILTLHGSGERWQGECGSSACGAPEWDCLLSDDIPHIRWHSMATIWLEHQEEHPAFILSPRLICPDRWASPGVPGAVARLVGEVADNHPIDRDRIYVTGLSIGGEGTYSMLEMSPDMFAAGVPMSGWGNPAAVSSYGRTPLWVFHGMGDDAVPWEESILTIQAMIESGRDPLYTHCKPVAFGNGVEDECEPVTAPGEQEILESNLLFSVYADSSHVIWTEAYGTDALADWLFSQRLN